ncbi:sensor histidine kinase [Aureliella helgolandensis]|uniref:histidine kinase n=1 Tax=Aureliella helgolandensis TaxID=2527968 RepID=A0A518GDL1_9BACT|nr:ATP-binding protein [Aureliella helgolandensis]QDV26681.1 Sensor protein ZraS [Aureliella helgolandensis]
MRLHNKITFATAATSLLLLSLGVSGAWYVLRLQHSNSMVLDVDVNSIRAAERLEMIVREMRHELDRFLRTEELAHLQHARNERPQLDEWLRQSQGLSLSEKEKRIVQETQRGLSTFFAELDRIAEQAATTKTEEDFQLLKTRVEQLDSEILTPKVLSAADDYLALNELELQESNRQNKAMAERLALALLLLGTCGAIAGLVAGYGVARGISRSIFQLSVPIRDVAGKLDEVVGPVAISTDPSVADLESVLQNVSSKVGAVVEQLHARHREIIRSDQLAAVGQLAAGLAHEIRNPLMCMKTLVQSSRRKGEAGTLTAHDLTIIDEEISRLENLMQAFLDFARPAKLEPQVVDVGQIIMQTVDLVSKRAEMRHIALGHNLGGTEVQSTGTPGQGLDTPLPSHILGLAPTLNVLGDATQLRQVLLNLLLNALDAVENGGRIWIEAVSETASPKKLPALVTPAWNNSQATLCLRITDNGRGLPAEGRERIYEPFYSTKETGLGLGLPISKRIIETHHGHLEAKDRPSGGAIFEIRLPLHRVTPSPLGEVSIQRSR